MLLTQSYNYLKNTKKQNFYDILENIYFKKTLNFYFENLSPKYVNVNHKIIPGETLEKILLKYKISNKEIRHIKKTLNLLGMQSQQLAEQSHPRHMLLQRGFAGSDLYKFFYLTWTENLLGYFYRRCILRRHCSCWRPTCKYVTL